MVHDELSIGGNGAAMGGGRRTVTRERQLAENQMELGEGATDGEIGIAANGAVKLASRINAAAVSQEEIERILDKAYRYVEQKPKRPIRAHKVMRKIQQTYWDRENGPLKDEKRILEIIEELNRIKDEDIPRMWSADDSYHMNCGWRDCFEAENMLIRHRS